MQFVEHRGFAFGPTRDLYSGPERVQGVAFSVARQEVLLFVPGSAALLVGRFDPREPSGPDHWTRVPIDLGEKVDPPDVMMFGVGDDPVAGATVVSCIEIPP